MKEQIILNLISLHINESDLQLKNYLNSNEKHATYAFEKELIVECKEANFKREYSYECKLDVTVKEWANSNSIYFELEHKLYDMSTGYEEEIKCIQIELTKILNDKFNQ